MTLHRIPEQGWDSIKLTKVTAILLQPALELLKLCSFWRTYTLMTLSHSVSGCGPSPLNQNERGERRETEALF